MNKRLKNSSFAFVLGKKLEEGIVDIVRRINNTKREIFFFDDFNKYDYWNSDRYCCEP